MVYCLVSTCMCNLGPFYYSSYCILQVVAKYRANARIAPSVFLFYYVCRMTNPANVVVIVEKLHAFLKTSVDVYLRTELVSKIIQLAERYG